MGAMTKDTSKADPLTTPYPDEPKARPEQPYGHLDFKPEERPAIPSRSPGAEATKPAPAEGETGKSKSK
jgi:hypothetical protein